jgi:hypothetical protein
MLLFLAWTLEQRMKQSCVPQASNWSTIFKVCILFRVENQNTQCCVYGHMGSLFPRKHINWSTEHQRGMPPGWKHLNTTKSIIFIFARTIYYVVCLPVAKHGYCASKRLIYTPRNSLRFLLCMKEKVNVEAHNLARYALALGQGRHLWLLESYDPVMIPTILAFD